MGKIGCTIDGYLDDSKFSEPMPWIGIYVAAASAVCAVGMAMDALHGLRRRKFWFPCNFFSLNATTLTLLAVATKLSVDLNTSMPRRQDQLTKLSGAALLCTVIANFMPSLGLMENKELVMNIMALGIFVITAIVNIGIQLATGVIYVFCKEHIALMFLMLVLLLLLISSAVTIPTTKHYLDLKYNNKYKLANKECNIMDTCTTEKLKDELMKFWTMAYTSCPHFVGGRLATCTASGVLCLVSTVIYAEAMCRSYFLHKSFNFCSGDSEYKWSTTLILVTHTVAIGVGTIAPAFRWFIAINIRCPKKANNACKLKLFKVENYWIRILLQWKECPLDFRYCGRHGRKFAHKTKNKLLDFCILMQILMVSLSKLVRLISIFFVSRSLIICRKAIKMPKCNSMVSSLEESGSQASSRPDFSRYALHLEGEEALIDLMMQSNRDVVGHWIGMGKKKQPKHLLRILEKLKSSPGFRGVHEFDSAQIPSLNSEDPPNCWALPVVTLTSIAISLPNVDFHSIKELIRCVHEGLMYIKVVEDNLDAKNDLVNIRRAAELVWLEIDLCYKWLDVDLRKTASEGQIPKGVLEGLSEKAKQRFIESRKKHSTVCPKESPSKWPINMLVANSMYRICQTLLVNCDCIEFENSKIMFDKLSTMITDITGACLTNLQRVISMQCHHGTIQERAKGVRSAILLLGKAENILEILRSQPLPSSAPDQLANIDNWCTLRKEGDYLSCSSSSTSNCTPTSQSSSDLCLTVD
ncbi:putative scarecrow-like protein 27-like [Capsicum annuum]|uniref:Transmembrane protein n=1 Tax=Capsicum annuum TaxID=4072 RepID=A0A1U8G5Q3_CAPAN|nr:uncharacterized protein LOC107862298 [Capsicum annuum]KAF3659236.1 putative scarecrow-like protein 27-like [Capsicum annuum]KAF3677021.1 putative scarecrow-like protein 27-like [Capsicum annuum]PHT92695.1 hypothetical protein T459_00577 [Capsicum annuum]